MVCIVLRKGVLYGKGGSALRAEKERCNLLTF